MTFTVELEQDDVDAMMELYSFYNMMSRSMPKDQPNIYTTSISMFRKTMMKVINAQVMEE